MLSTAHSDLHIELNTCIVHFQYLVKDGIKKEKNGFYVKIIHQYLSSQEHLKSLLR